MGHSQSANNKRTTTYQVSTPVSKTPNVFSSATTDYKTDNLFKITNQEWNKIMAQYNKRTQKEEESSSDDSSDSSDSSDSFEEYTIFY